MRSRLPYFRADLESQRSRLRSRSLVSAAALLFATMLETETPPTVTGARGKPAARLTSAAAPADVAAPGRVNSTLPVTLLLALA